MSAFEYKVAAAEYEAVGMVVIHDQVLTADAASFDVQNIPQGYKHLRVVAQLRGTLASIATGVNVQFNGDTGANYDVQYLLAADTGGASDGIPAQVRAYAGGVPGSTATASKAGLTEFTIPNYAGTTFEKTLVGMAGHTRTTTASDFYVIQYMSHWRSAAAINRVAVLPDSGDWLAGSRLTIYGLGGAPQLPTMGADGWTTDADTWTYASATTFTVPGDQTAKFSKGTRLKLTQTTVKYFVVVASSYGAPNTTVTITGGDDYTFANAAVSANYYSYAVNPQGYPGWFNFSPTYTGFSANPAGNYCKFRIDGNMCTFKHARANGTSNATGFTFTVPVAPIAGQNASAALAFPHRHTNNGVTGINFGLGEAQDATTTVSLYRDLQGTAWTGSGAKGAYFTFMYEF